MARSRNAAAAARPPRAWARPAARSSSAATSSSGPAAASARCQARRSGSTSVSVASRQCPVHQAPGVRRGRSVNRRAHQRMAKPYSSVDLDQPGRFRRLAMRVRQSRSRSAARHKRTGSPVGSAAATNTGAECRPAGPRVARGSSPRCRPDSERTRQDPKSTASCAAVETARQLQQGQRVTPGLGDDLRTDPLVQSAVNHCRQQLLRIGIGKALHQELR